MIYFYIYITYFISYVLYNIICYIYLAIKSKNPDVINHTYHTRGGSSYKNNNCYFGETEHKIDYKEAEYYRELPCKDDLLRAYWLVYNYQLGKHDEDLIICLFLKWIRDGNMKFEKKSSNSVIRLIKPPKNCSEIEKNIYTAMFEASLETRENGSNLDYELDIGEFKLWYSKNISKFSGWFSQALDYEIDCLVNEGKIKIEKKKIKNIHNYDYKLRYIVDKSMKEEATKLAGLKRFLIDFSIINNREVLEVMLFDNYLIYAALFGITNQVFDNLYELIQNKYSVDTISYRTISENDISIIKYLFY